MNVKALLLCVLGGLLLTLPLMAQGTTGVLKGTVTSGGEALPGVTITISNGSTVAINQAASGLQATLPAINSNELTLTISTHKVLYNGGCEDITDAVMTKVNAMGKN